MENCRENYIYINERATNTKFNNRGIFSNNFNVLFIEFEIVNVTTEQYAYKFLLYSMFNMWKVLPE